MSRFFMARSDHHHLDLSFRFAFLDVLCHIFRFSVWLQWYISVYW